MASYIARPHVPLWGVSLPVQVRWIPRWSFRQSFGIDPLFCGIITRFDRIRFCLRGLYILGSPLSFGDTSLLILNLTNLRVEQSPS